MLGSACEHSLNHSKPESQLTLQEQKEINDIKEEIEKMLNDEGSNLSFLSDFSDDELVPIPDKSTQILGKNNNLGIPAAASTSFKPTNRNPKFFSEFNQPQIQQLKSEIQSKNGEIIILRQKLQENSRLKNEIYQKNQEIIKLKSKSKFVPIKSIIHASQPIFPTKNSQQEQPTQKGKKDSCVQADGDDFKLLQIIKETGLVELQHKSPFEVLQTLNRDDPNFILKLEAVIKAQLLLGNIGSEFHVIKTNHRINRLLCDYLPMEFILNMEYVDNSDYLGTLYRILKADSQIRIDELLSLLGGSNDYLVLRILGKMYYLKILPSVHQQLIDYLYQLDRDDNDDLGSTENKNEVMSEGFRLLVKCIGEVTLERYTKLYCMVKKRDKRCTMGLHQLFE